MVVKNKCCFIIPYFGKLPDSFSVFLKSCKWNPEFTWLLITDDESKFNYPDNVKKVYMTFDDLRKLVDKKLGFHVALEKAYKLCDLKPAYGLVFEEYIKNYDFWGHCDIDTVIGKIKDFITDDMLESYDKLFCMGHFILYKNSIENNKIFMNKHNGRYVYKDVLKNPNPCWFDEEWNGDCNINQIFIAAGKKVLKVDWSANFNVKMQRFSREILVYNNTTGKFTHASEGYKDALYYWYKGGIYRADIENNKLNKEEYLYLHFQWRNMKVAPSILDAECFKIVPNAFLPLEEPPQTVSEFKKIRRWTICFYSLNQFWKREIVQRALRWKKRFMNSVSKKRK